MESWSSQISDVNISDLGCLRSQISDDQIPGCEATLRLSLWSSLVVSVSFSGLHGPGASIQYYLQESRREGPAGTRPVAPWHTTPGTPPSLPTSATRVPRHAGVHVLWALNKECVTLKCTLKSVWSRLSAFWLPFMSHVARIGQF